MTKSPKELMAEADGLLETVSVSGSSAYALVEARKLLSAAYRMLPDLPNQNGKEDAVNGG